MTQLNDGALERLKIGAFERFPIAFVLTNPNMEDNPIVYVNRAFEQLTGYASDAAIGRNCRFLQGEKTDPLTVNALREAIRNEESHQTELLNYRADGSTFVNELFIEPIYDDAGNLSAFLGLQRGQSDKPGADNRVQQQLQEIQHRVKNHLQMVVSMIRLQSQKTSGREASVDYAALAYRVETLQLLYQEMNKADGDVEVPMGAYVSRIATTIGHLEGRENIRLNIDTESFYVPVDTAARVGLMASEIITNSYQHAFDGRAAGLVEVKLKQLSGGVMRLEVMDDGIGMPRELKWPNSNTMGAGIVQSLIGGLNGQLDISRGVAGTSVSVDVPLTDTRAKHEN